MPAASPSPTRARMLIQDYLGHRNIQHTVRYTAPNRTRRDLKNSGADASALGFNLFLGLQLGVVLTDERLDQGSAGQNTEPLFLEKRDRKAPHAVQRDCAFLAHLEAYPALVLGFELGILCPQPLQFRLHLRVAHRVSSPAFFLASSLFAAPPAAN